MLQLHWVGFLGFGVILAFIISSYYVLIRGVGLIHLLPHISLIFLFAVYTLLFVMGDFSLAVVYFNSHSGLPLHYRVAGSWSNGGGSLLLFSTLTSLIAILLYKHTSRLSAVGFNLVSLSGLLLALVNGVFDKLEGPVVEGLGLNPLLVNPWVYPHPIATFISYSLVASATLTALSNNYGVSRLLASLSWATLTLALLFGGMWSYETLGWGGYWAWDPVEVAQLIPWLLVTASLHSLQLDRRFYTLLMAMSLASIYYGFLVTRAGITPLHGFASPEAYTAYISLASIAIVTLVAYFKTRGLSVEVRGLRGYSMLITVILTLYSAAVLTGALAPSVLANITGLTSLNPPAFDSGVRLYTTLLAPAVLVALLTLPLAFIPRSSHAMITSAMGALIAVITLLAITSTGYTYAPRSGFYANILGPIIGVLSAYTTLILAVNGLILLARRATRLGLTSIQHSLLALALLGITLSAPYAYNQGYFETTTLKLGVDSGGLQLQGVSYEVTGGYINLRDVVARDRVLLEATSQLLALISSIRVYVENVDRSTRLLDELGVTRLIEGVKVGYVEFETREGVVRVENVTFKLELLDLGNGTLLLPVISGVNMGGFDHVNLSKPVELELGGLRVYILSLRSFNGLIAVECIVSGSRELRLPMVIGGYTLRAYKLYLESVEAREVYAIAKRIGLDKLEIPECRSNLECINIVPEGIPRLVELNTLLRTPGGLVEAHVKYDVGGELAGVKGLVPRSVIVRMGLSDYYIALYPKVYNVTRMVTVTEAEIAYLSRSYEGLSEGERLTLTALLILSRTRSDIGDPRALINLNPLEYTLATLKLYEISRNWSKPTGEVIVRSKTVPYTWLLWIGVTTAVLVHIATITVSLREQGKPNKYNHSRERVVEATNS